MEIQHLNTFLTLASVLNFTRTGRELGYSQPNISMQIQQLEQEIGAPLFHRTGHRITLTQYGEELLPYARQIVAMAEKMENFLKSENALGGTVRFGIMESVCNWIVEQQLMQYHRRFPKVRVEMTVGTVSQLKEQLETGLLDVVCLIDDALPEERFRCIHRVETPIVIVANKNGSLAQRESLTVQDLCGEEFIMTEETIAYAGSFRMQMEAQGQEFRLVARVTSANQACRIVSRSSFLSLVPALNAQLSRFNDGITILNVTDFCKLQYLQTVCHPGRTPVPQVEGFLEVLGSVIREIAAE